MLFCFFLSFIGCYLSFHDTLFVMARSCCRYTVYEDGGAYDIGICPGQTLEAIRLWASWDKTCPIMRRPRLSEALAELCPCVFAASNVHSSFSLKISAQTAFNNVIEVPMVNASTSNETINYSVVYFSQYLVRENRHRRLNYAERLNK